MLIPHDKDLPPLFRYYQHALHGRGHDAEYLVKMSEDGLCLDLVCTFRKSGVSQLSGTVELLCLLDRVSFIIISSNSYCEQLLKKARSQFSSVEEFPMAVVDGRMQDGDPVSLHTVRRLVRAQHTPSYRTALYGYQLPRLPVDSTDDNLRVGHFYRILFFISRLVLLQTPLLDLAWDYPVLMQHMGERAREIKRYAEENELVCLDYVSHFEDQNERLSRLRRATFGRGLLKYAQFVLRTLTALDALSKQTLDALSNPTREDCETVLSVRVGSSTAISMTRPVLEALSRVAQWWDNEHNRANTRRRLSELVNVAAREIFGDIGPAIEVVTKPFHSFVEKFMFRAPYVTDFVRCTLVVPRDQYVECLDKALGMLDCSSDPLRWIVKPDMGEKATWPWAMALLQLEPGGWLYAEVQVVPRDVYDMEHGGGGDGTHADYERRRLEPVFKKLTALGIGEAAIESLLNETKPSNTQLEPQLGEAVATLKTLFSMNSALLI